MQTVGQTEGGAPASSRGPRTLALASVISVYLLVVLGGIVRITGSGMGCGDDWPLCNGKLIPPMDLPTLIEYGHRLAAVAVSALIVGLAVWAWRRRAEPRWCPLWRLAWLAVILLAVQVLLGGVTVWLELPPTSVVLHLGTGMALLGALVAACAMAWGVGQEARVRDRASMVAWSAAALGLVAVLLGALVANLGAAPACQGFPLCNGRWLPGANWRIQLHWLHRATAYLLALGVFALPVLAARSRGQWGLARATAWIAVAAAAGQILVATAMVLSQLSDGLRALHVAAGAAVFAALVLHAWAVSHPARERAR